MQNHSQQMNNHLIKRPIPIKIVITGYALLAITILLTTAYSAYIGWVAETGSLSEFQAGFIKGVGFNPATFTTGDAGAYAGTMTPTIIVSLLSLFFILRRMAGFLFVVFILDAIFLTGGIGYILKAITLTLLLIPTSQMYFKTKKHSNVADHTQSV